MNATRVRQLLGAELAQDDPRYLKYSVPRSDLLQRLRLFDDQLIIVNAARGAGKSGLLINHKDEIARFFARDITIHKFYSDIALPPDGTNVNQYVAFWKNSLIGWVVDEIGSRKRVAFSDSDIAAVELAEKHGAKERNVIGSVLKRLKLKSLPVEKLEYDPSVTDGQFARILSAMDSRFWLLLDEMDDHYTDARSDCLVGLLQAAKHITQTHNQISIRLTIRPHIMTILRKTHDIVQKFRSNEVAIHWNESQLEELLARRVALFDGSDENRRQLSLEILPTYRPTLSQTRQELIGRHFEDFDASFAEGKTSNYRALYTLSFYRPRWLIEYCALALEVAEGDFATRTDLKLALEKYGSNRIQFLCGEHNYHVPRLEAIINQVLSVRKVNLGSSGQLRDLLIEKIVKPGIAPVPSISGESLQDFRARQEQVALDVANNLYMTEFLRAREFAGGKDDHRFYRFQDRPSLLASWSSGPKITWQLHPTFSRSLNVEDSGVYRVEGDVREFGKKGRDRRKKQVQAEINTDAQTP